MRKIVGSGSQGAGRRLGAKRGEEGRGGSGIGRGDSGIKTGDNGGGGEGGRAIKK